MLDCRPAVLKFSIIQSLTYTIMVALQASKVVKRPSPTTVKRARKERMLGAVAAIREANGALSLSQAARQYDFSKSTL